MLQRGLGSRGRIGSSTGRREEIERDAERIGSGAGKFGIVIESQGGDRRSNHARRQQPFAAAWVKAARLAASLFTASVASAR